MPLNLGNNLQILQIVNVHSYFTLLTKFLSKFTETKTAPPFNSMVLSISLQPSAMFYDAG